MDGRMQQVLMEVWLVVAVLSLPTLTQCSPLFVMSVPNPLTVGTPEKVFVEAQDYTGDAFDVIVWVKDFPFKTKMLAEQTLQLSQNNNYQALADIRIPTGDGVFDEDGSVNQYVYLIAQFPGKVMERVVLVSFQSGYIFVQTDKTIYTPSSTVRYRIYSLDVSMKPSEQPVTVDVVDAEGAVLRREDLTPHKGVCSGDYKLQAFASPGTWTIVTRFKNTTQNNFTYNFEVKHYVLPQVEVMLSPQKSHFYIDDEELMVNITARYLNRMEVTGAGFIEFSLQHLETDHRSVVSTQRVKIDGGRGQAAVTRQRLLQVAPGTDGIQHLTGAIIHVNVTVVTQTGYETAHANSGIQIVTSPYTLHFKNTPEYFKPGIPFDVMLLVRNVDGSPAEGVQVQLSNRKSSDDITGTTGSNGLVKLTVNTDIADSSLAITATTKDPDLIDEHQARQSMTAFPYETTAGSKNYLHISISETELMLGDEVKANLIVKRSPGAENQDLTYLILSKGHLLHAERIKSQGQPVVSLSLTVTKDMVPSFRIVAYYHVGPEEVVSDSVRVDVKDTCIGKLIVEQSAPGEVYFQTRMEITGDPGARVGLVAVDKGVYVLNNKHRLTQTKTWDVIERQDTGCTAGSGKNSMGVFYDAGLLFETSTAGGTNSRKDSRCPSHQRKQRSLEDEDDDELTDILDDVIPRSRFQESFFWHVEQLPTSGDGVQNSSSVSVMRSIIMTEASSWVISAVSLSEASGFCVADPIEISRTKALFTLDLKVPPFSKCNEQLEVIATLHNPEDEDIKVHVRLMESPTICSLATGNGGYIVTVTLHARTTQSVPFVIIPMETGTHSVAVVAVDTRWRRGGVRKAIVVLPAGVQRKTTVKLDINPSISGGYLTTVIGLWLVDLIDPIPNMPVQHVITAQAQPMLSLLEVGMIQSSESLTPLLTMRWGGGRRVGRGGGGGGEQDLVAMTNPLVATYYLDHTHQLNDMRTQAIRSISLGYQRLLACRKQDGSYSVTKTTRSSTWLTAYAAKVLSMASGLISVDGDAICRALLWLAINTQDPDGVFREHSPVPYTASITGNVYGRDKDASMTAFVVIAMQEAPSGLCTAKYLSSSVSRATHYLGLRIHTLTNPYTVAMVTYALANEGLRNADILFRYSNTGGVFWPVPGNRQFSLEATAYALLALVRAGEFDKAAPIVTWLNQQQFYGGGYGSTQANLVVYQALSEYSNQVRLRQRESSPLEVTLNTADHTHAAPVTWTFTQANTPLQRSLKVRLDKNMTVTAKGSGRGILSVMAMYYSMPRKEEEGCHNMKLDVSFQKILQGSTSEALGMYLLTVDIMVNTKDHAPSTALLNIGLLTGFSVNREDLQKLAANKTWDIEELSPSQANILIYMNEVSSVRPERFALRMHQVANVSLLQPAAVSLREHTSQDPTCLKFYHPQKIDGTLGQICHQHVCRCAAESCAVQRREVPKGVSRNDVSCIQFRDYVYKVTVEDVQLSSVMDIYHMSVAQVVKQGTDSVMEGDRRQFLSSPLCREGLGLTAGKSYLVIGSPTDLMETQDGYHYVLSKQTWVEYWPTDSEGQTEPFKSTYSAIQDFAEELSLIGCQR